MILIGLDGQRIIIFGGLIGTADSAISSTDALYVLNLINFEWSIPKISGQNPKSIYSRYGHKANVIGKYMVISFGKYNKYDLNDFINIILIKI